MKVQKFDMINLIDSPGFGDPNKKRSDIKILSEIVDTILNKAS